tara:strand:- start:2177 stop:2341 length:165 start_codon:yes stop_codon:yes gene_type:complete
MRQNKKQSIEASIELLDDVYKIMMKLIKPNIELLDDIQDILSEIDDVQYKIKTL